MNNFRRPNKIGLINNNNNTKVKHIIATFPFYIEANKMISFKKPNKQTNKHIN